MLLLAVFQPVPRKKYLCKQLDSPNISQRVWAQIDAAVYNNVKITIGSFINNKRRVLQFNK